MVTLAQYRHAFTDRVPFIGDRFTTGADEAGDGTYVGKSATTEPKRMVASSDLADIGRATSQHDTSADYYQGGYVFIPSLGHQRRITDSGYTDYDEADDVLDDGGTTPVGYYIVSREFPAVIDAGLAAEYHPLLPPAVNADRLPSIHTVINRALRSMRWVRRITFTGNAGDRYSLASYPEVTQDSQVAAVYMGEVAANNEPSTLYGGARLRWNGASGYLITDQYQSSGQSFTADIYIPAASWIKSSGTWQASTVGLVDEDDEAMPPVDQVVTVARYFAFDALAGYSPSEPDRAAWMYERDRAAALARPLMQFQQPEVSLRTHTVLKTGVAGAYGTRSWP